MTDVLSVGWRDLYNNPFIPSTCKQHFCSPHHSAKRPAVSSRASGVLEHITDKTMSCVFSINGGRFQSCSFRRQIKNLVGHFD